MAFGKYSQYARKKWLMEYYEMHQKKNTSEVDFFYSKKMRDIGEISYQDFIQEELVL